MEFHILSNTGWNTIWWVWLLHRCWPQCKIKHDTLFNNCSGSWQITFFLIIRNSEKILSFKITLWTVGTANLNACTLSKYLWYIDTCGLVATHTLKKIELLFTSYQQGGHFHQKVESLKEELTSIFWFSTLGQWTLLLDNVVTNTGKTIVRRQKASRLWPSLFALFTELFFVLVGSHASPTHMLCTSFTLNFYPKWRGTGT